MSDERARLSYVDPGEVPASLRPLFDRFIRQRGKVPNLFRVAAHRAPIAEVFAGALEAIMGPGEVPQRLKELLSVRVSHLNGCEY